MNTAPSDERWAVALRARAWHELEGRRSRLWSQHAVEDASGVSAVLRPVSSIDLVVDVMVGVDECDVLLNTGGLYPTFMPLLGATEPMTTAPSNGAGK